MTNIIQLKGEISNGKNIIFYDKSIFDCYNKLKDDYICIYFNEPTPVKVRLMKVVDELAPDTNYSLNRLTIAELKEILFKELTHDRLIITFNHFERLTKSTVQVYQYLNSMNNIQFVCSFSQEFKPEIYPFFKTFEFVNKEEYETKSTKDEINITYFIYALLSLTCFFVYIKASQSILMAAIFLGGAWFALIVFRTLIFVGGRA